MKNFIKKPVADSCSRPAAFLIIGLGSMGQRRIRNLQFHGEKNIIGFDLTSERCVEAQKKYGIRVTAEFKKLPLRDYDALIIATPPASHGDYIRWALKNQKHFFVEATTSDDGYADVFKFEAEHKIGRPRIVMAPSCTYRFFAPVKMLKDFIKAGRIGKVLAYNHHMGQYLPDWHPWEDYRKVYFAQKETGACREMFPYELMWLGWLVESSIADVAGRIVKVSDLDMSADDVAVANVRYDNGVVGNLLVDVISRQPLRELRILGSEGALEWSWRESIIKIFDAKTKKTETIEVPKGNPATGYLAAEEMYQDEMRAFLEAIYGRAGYPYTFREDLKILKMLYALEKYSELR